MPKSEDRMTPSSLREDSFDLDVEELNLDEDSHDSNDPKQLLAERHQKRQKVLDAASSFNLEVASAATTMIDGGELDELRTQAKHIIKSLYPDGQVRPTLQDLVRTLLSNTTMEWKRGDWIEYRGNDMKWHLGQVRGVVHQAPDSFDWNDPANEGKDPDYNTFYNIAKETLLSSDSVRAPFLALQYMFGSRPWVWQQYALLKTERYVRFQTDHERDFMEVDCQKLADDMWTRWLEDEKNEEFRNLFESYGHAQQAMLVNHLITPFELLDDITENQKAWEFDDPDMSLYTYLSILGSGSFFVLFCTVLQLVIPLILLANAMSDSERFTFTVSSSGLSISTTWDDFCRTINPDDAFDQIGDREYYDQVLGKSMILAVMSVYLLTVVPGTVIKFYRTTGEATTTYSRLNSLRAIVWKQADDSFLQRLGYKLDRYMNTSYLMFLYGTMLFILYNTSDVLDLLLNALAAEFVHQIDEEIAQSDWYDEDRRWITAGAWQLAVQSVLQIRIMENPAEFCKRYDIDLNEYSEALGAKSGHLPRIRKASLAEIDDKDPALLDPEEALFQMCDVYARRKKNMDGYEQFHKKLENFSFFDSFYMKLIPSKNVSGIFDRTRSFRTWSRWNRIIFLSKVPEEAITIESIDSVPCTVVKKIRPNTTPVQRFLADIASVLSGKQMVTDLQNTVAKGLYGRLPFHFFDGIFQWFAYVLQLTFPICVAGGVVLIPACY
mmetsp:Transcript_10127/g.18616  ORF Transcript_10127/g.18616 Transcript_10127/m.18616 type:complete len:721 (-) Transcript_10127:87-2249(-)